MTQKNLNKEEVLEIIKGFPLQPSRGKIITTINTEVFEEDEIEGSLEALAEYQYIIAVPSNSLYEPGDKVLVDIMRMSVPVGSSTNAYDQTSTQIQLDPVRVGENVFTFISEGFIKAKDLSDE